MNNELSGNITRMRKLQSSFVGCLGKQSIPTITKKHGHTQFCSTRGSLLARVVTCHFPRAYSIQRKEVGECRGEEGIFRIRAFKVFFKNENKSTATVTPPVRTYPTGK